MNNALVELPAPTPSLAIGVFTRAPEPGATKTRLIPLLGAQGAAQLHTRMLTHTLEVAAQTPAALTLWVTDSITHPHFAALAKRFGCAIAPQTGADLGTRMRRALAHMLQHHRFALVIGSDCMVHSAQGLVQAAARLQHHDMVFTPAQDGGYVLVGARRDCAPAFNAVAWGTAQVMAQTRMQLQAAGIPWAEEPVLWDIDTPADFLRAQQAGLV